MDHVHLWIPHDLECPLSDDKKEIEIVKIMWSVLKSLSDGEISLEWQTQVIILMILNWLAYQRLLDLSQDKVSPSLSPVQQFIATWG